MGRGAESIRPFREALPLEVRDYIGGEVRKPLPHKACSAGRRHKKGELGSVHLFKLVVGRDAGLVSIIGTELAPQLL